MSAESVVNIVASIITCVATISSLIVAIIAISKSNKQIDISNKQNLFKDRVKSYLIIKGLIELYTENKELIEKERGDSICFASDFVLIQLINNSYLEVMGQVVNKPLHNDEQKEFLKKIEELKNEAEKTKFIFSQDVSIYLFEYVKAYEELLMQLYKYIVFLDRMHAWQENNPIKKDVKELAEEMHEKEDREELIKKYQALTRAFNSVKEHDTMRKVEEQIKFLE